MLYKRKYKLSIETYRGIGITLDADLKINFVIQKQILQIYQWAEITIYNLSAETETDILQNGKSVTLEAGYENEPYGVIFKGPIRLPLRGKEDGTTYFLKLLCIDGDDALNLGICQFVLANGQTAQQIARQIARSSTFPFDIEIDDLGSQTTQRGVTVFGRPGSLLRDLALDNNAAFYMQDGIGHISKLTKPPPAVVPELNAQSGMIGMPTQTDQGIQVKCLIDPTIKLDSWFKLNNRSIILAQVEFGVPQTLLDLDGLYRVIGITITGDTRGQDWYFDIEAVSQTGSVPAMLSSDTQNGM
jgi:hypothetical protein